MDLFEFEERLRIHNFNYRQASNAAAWQTSQKEHSKLIQISYTSPAHLKLWERYRDRKQGENNV